MALGLSFPRPMADTTQRPLFWRRLVRRSATLVILGLLVEATYVCAISAGAPYPGHGGLSYIRIPGILQRIGLCYLIGGALIAVTSRRIAERGATIAPQRLLACIGTILLGYWVLLRFVPVPGYGVGLLTPDGSLPAFIDRTLFTAPHLWPLGSATGEGPATYDPEGLLSTLPATTNLLFGALAAWAWKRDPYRATLHIAAAGVVLLVGGLALDPVFEINKRIWTSSFALFSSGVSALILAVLVVTLRVPAGRVVAAPFRVLGGNAILAFLLSTAFSRLSGFPILLWRGELLAPQQWGFAVASMVFSNSWLASLACAVVVVATVTVLLWPLHRRAIHFRI